MFRVQKVLLAEYNEVYEPVLVENPFCLVDSEGVGLRQYQIALTGTKLVFGCDSFYKQDDAIGQPNWHNRGLDPEIECFDLVSMMPLKFLRFNFYKRRDRYHMMIHLEKSVMQSDKAMIFEFGGHVFQQYFWHTWRDRVASIHTMQPFLNEISHSSPFSSTDVQLEEETQSVDIHTPPRSMYTLCYTTAGGG